MGHACFSVTINLIKQNCSNSLSTRQPHLLLDTQGSPTESHRLAVIESQASFGSTLTLMRGWRSAKGEPKPAKTVKRLSITTTHSTSVQLVAP
jgi:hypothetical protein